ncbi:MAG: hypothetical protein HC911_15080 [Chloroflexaceae bacterium]|nr:hypothetical protein [Chloroflexaceae bacterium]
MIARTQQLLWWGWGHVWRIIGDPHAPPRPHLDHAADSWGWAAPISLLSTLGLAVVVLSYEHGRHSLATASPLHWVGLLLIVMPIALRLLMPATPRRERLWLAVLLGLLCYLVKVLYSPLDFRFSDELQHWRSTSDLLQYQRLFTYNHILPVSPLYPGLQATTVPLIHMTGLPIFPAGVIALGVARLVFVLALFHFAELAAKSPFVGGIAVLVYATNPHFLFFHSMFLYQSMAVPLMLVSLYALARWEQSTPAERPGLRAVTIFAMMGVVMTHHITSYGMAAVLLLWFGANFYVRWRNHARPPVVSWLVMLLVILILTWMVYVATVTVGYLAPQLGGALLDLTNLIAGEAKAEETFRPPSGPVFERVFSLLMVATTLGYVSVAAPVIWLRQQHNALALAMGIGALGYFLSIVLRFSSSGAEMTGRLWTFVYVFQAVALGILLREAWLAGVRRWLLRLGGPLLFVLLFIASITAGWPPYWGRLPGPYLVSASERSVTPEGIAAGQWAAQLGRGKRWATDFTHYMMVGAYGAQDPIFNASAVLLTPTMGDAERDFVRWADLDFILIDERLSTDLPQRGYFFDGDDPDIFRYTEPLERDLLTKYQRTPGVSRIYDSGNLVIYTVRAWSNNDAP